MLHELAFVDPDRQGRFEALMRDLAGVSLVEATAALDEGRVLVNGEPYAWEADEMAFWLRESPAEPGEVAAERDRVKFAIVPPPAGPSLTSRTSAPGSPGRATP